MSELRVTHVRFRNHLPKAALICAAVLVFLGGGAAHREAKAQVAHVFGSSAALHYPIGEFVFEVSVPDGDDRLLVAGFSMPSGSQMTGVTFAGHAFTRQIARDEFGVRSEIWTLVNPNVATGIFRFTMSPNTVIIVSLHYFVGVNQANPVRSTGTSASANAVGSTVTIDNSRPDDMIFNQVVTLATEAGIVDFMAIAPNVERTTNWVPVADMHNAEGTVPGSAPPVSAQWEWTATDPGPCVATAIDITAANPWTVAEAIEDVIMEVDSFHLPRGLTKALVTKLEVAKQSHAAGHFRATIGQLQAFINQVEDKRGNVLTTAEADQLIAEASEIQAVVMADAAAARAIDDDVSEPGFLTLQNSPNPFNPVTTIQYEVPNPGGVVTLNVYDVRGALVRSLVNGYRSPGLTSITWDSRNDRGKIVPSGVYFYRLQVAGFTTTRRMLLLK